MSSMESVSPPTMAPSLGRSAASTVGGGKLAALVELTKPRIVALVLLTVAVGYLLGNRGATHPLSLLVTLAGTGLVAAGASVWNQIIERDRDARMRRTRSRPLPSGRVAVGEASLFGSALAAGGLALLLLAPHALGMPVAAVTFLLYVLVYTPLKPRTTLNTVVGAIPGALPPVIGWASATGRLGIEAFALFLIVFLWQFPHFLAIAWIHREDYARGGMKMLPIVDPSGVLTGRQAAAYALALVPGGLLPAVVGLAGPWYFAGALALGIYYLASAARFWANVGDAPARQMMGASYLYLPAILLLLVLNPLPV